MAKRKKVVIEEQAPVVEGAVVDSERADAPATPEPAQPDGVWVWYPSDIERAEAFHYVDGSLQEDIHGKGLPPKFYPTLNAVGHAYPANDGWHILDIRFDGVRLDGEPVEEYVRRLNKRCMRTLTPDTTPRTQVSYPTSGKALVNAGGILDVTTIPDPEYDVDVIGADKGINGWKWIVRVKPVVVDGRQVERLVLNAEPEVKSGKATLVYKHGVEPTIRGV